MAPPVSHESPLLFEAIYMYMNLLSIPPMAPSIIMTGGARTNILTVLSISN